MPLKVEKQFDRENSQRLIQRFSQKMKRSQILREVRKRMFKAKKKSKQLKKLSALRRERKKQEYEATRKLGRQ